ncbi:PE-PPE domain-containing protein [Mycobacterium sp.]|uniref:PE-PPE domain-containing protein n=1 Tax=Mycobacterium sp. TaxID=1785 RepID=UPI0031E2023A
MNTTPARQTTPPRRIRRSAVALLSAGGAALLGLTATMHAAFAFGDNTALVMGPSGFPIPAPPYIAAVDQLYLDQLGYSGYSPQALWTPEGLYPVTGVKSLTIDASAAQGVTALNTAIDQQIDAGNHVLVFGYSQSSLIASTELGNLTASPNPSDPADLSFLLVGDPNNPDGGLLTRFPGLSIPSLGTTFGGATPDTDYPTDVYTTEYDGFADFPRYPLNLLADINAYLGILYDHANYTTLQPDQITGATPLPTLGDPMTHYFIIPSDNLPLLEPLRVVPFVGTPLADLLQPDLTYLVNLGYGSPLYGWSPNPVDGGYANVATPFGLFPSLQDIEQLPGLLVSGAKQGVAAALNDLQHPTFIDAAQIQHFVDIAYTFGLIPSLHPTLLELIDAASTYANGDVPVTPPAKVVDALSSIASTFYAALLPTADIATALGVTLPADNAVTFVSQLADGNLLGAVGDPLALDFAFVPLAIGYEGAVLGEAAATAATLLAGLVP